MLPEQLQEFGRLWPQAREAIAVPQLPGLRRPGGSVLYICGGTNEHGKPCGKLLFVWVSDTAVKKESGRVEIKCRRCKTLNVAPLDGGLSS